MGRFDVKTAIVTGAAGGIGEEYAKALAAEGKLSAYVLMALPFGIGGFLFVSNPSYIGVLTQSPLGWGMIAAGVVMLTIGGIWLSKVVRIRF